MGSVARSCSRRASRPSPRSEADSGVSTKPAAMRLTRTGASSSARLAIERRQRGGDRAEMSASPALIVPPAGAADEEQRAAGPHLAGGVARDLRARSTAARSIVARACVEVHLAQRRVVRAAGR